MVEIIGYILFALYFVLLPISLIGVGFVAILDFIEGIRFIKAQEKLEQN
jgi:hypothetical protein